MEWDDTTFEGKHAIWWWFVSRSQIDTLCELVVREHRGYRLWITSFDSGSITPSAEELSDGWKTVDGAMVSPPLEWGSTSPMINTMNGIFLMMIVRETKTLKGS